MRVLYGSPEIPEGLFWFITIAYLVLVIVMIVKFFGIASDLRKIRNTNKGDVFEYIQEARSWLSSPVFDEHGNVRSNSDNALNYYKRALICVDRGKWGEIPSEFLDDYDLSEDFATYLKRKINEEMNQVVEELENKSL